MYDVFTLREIPEGKIAGYRWDREDPEKVICIVHGIGEYSGRYERVAETFSREGCAVLSMDLRGHGISPGKRGHCAPRKEVLEDVDALLERAEREYPGKEIVLYGHSMGGNIALDYRSRGGRNDLPSAYLITAPWIRLVRPIPGPAVKLVRTAARLAPRLTISASINAEDLGNPENLLSDEGDPLIHNKISLRCALDGFEIGLALERGTLEDNGRAKEIPTLIMHGGEDRICDIRGTEAVAARLERTGAAVEFRRWPGLYHEIHNGGADSRGDEVLEEMIRFFGSTGSAL